MATINAINTSYPIEPAAGGTGVASPSAHGIMVAEGSSAMVTKVLTNGQMLIGSTGADPAAATITSTSSTLTVTSGAGSLNIDINGPVSGTNGGTGVNNGASTITIGGNVAYSGAFTFTGTLTANTSVTFPTSGTLVNTAVTTLSSLASVGTVTTGTWSAGLKDYTETVTAASTGAAYTINMANGNWFKLTLTANCTFSMSNVPATGGQGCSLTLVLIQDATGSRTVTWPASFDWGTTGAPTLTTTANKVDIVTAISDDNGPTFRALLAGKGFSA